VNDIGASGEHLEVYGGKFGMNNGFSLWMQGCAFIFINSITLASSTNNAESQMVWLRKELFNAKLCACHVFVFSYHSLFINTLEEEISSVAPIPMEYRKELHEMMLDASVKVFFYSAATEGSTPPDVFVPKKLSPEDEEDRDADRYRGMLMKAVSPADVSGEGNQVHICSLYRYHYEHDAFTLQSAPETWKLKDEEKVD
jgi:hypothetical protein